MAAVEVLLARENHRWRYKRIQGELLKLGHRGSVHDPPRSPAVADTSGAVRHILTGHTSGVVALGVAPDGSWLASADYGGEVRIWDSVTGITRHTNHTSGVEALTVARDGSWLASAGYGEVRIWASTTGAVRQALLR